MLRDVVWLMAEFCFLCLPPAYYFNIWILVSPVFISMLFMQLLLHQISFLGLCLRRSRLPTSLFSSYPHRTASTDVSLGTPSLPPTCLPLGGGPLLGQLTPGGSALLPDDGCTYRAEAGLRVSEGHVSLGPENPPFPLLDPGCRITVDLWTWGKTLRSRERH